MAATPALSAPARLRPPARCRRRHFRGPRRPRAPRSTLSGTGNVTARRRRRRCRMRRPPFGGAIDGMAGWTLTAGTAETLTGDNLYSGATTINGGTLVLSGTGSISASSDVIDDATFDISATTAGASIKTLSGTGNVTLGARRRPLSNAPRPHLAGRSTARAGSRWRPAPDADRRQSLYWRDHDPMAARWRCRVPARLRPPVTSSTTPHLRYLGDLRRFDQDAVGHRQRYAGCADADAVECIDHIRRGDRRIRRTDADGRHRGR